MARSRSISNRTRGWIAAALAILQLTLISAGHPMHAWMHAMGSAHQSGGHQNCSSHAPSQGPDLAAANEGHCCTSGLNCPTRSVELGQSTDECSPESDSIPTLGNSHSRHHCWSTECAFYKGIHQTSVLTETGTAEFQNLLLEQLLIPALTRAENLTFSSLRVRGPPVT